MAIVHSRRTRRRIVASERHWRGKTYPRPDILFLENGAALRVRGGHLEAFPSAIRSISPPVRAITGNPRPSSSRVGAAFSRSAAVHFCIDHHITILAAGYLGDLTTFVAPRPIQDAALVRAQCAAKPAPDRP